MDSQSYYLNRLLAMSDRHVIKVIAGMHGVGKSSLLFAVARTLAERGVPDENILLADFAALRYGETFNYREMNGYIENNINNGGELYLFLDSMPDLTAFDGIVGSLYLNRRLNIYITAANRRIVAELTDALPTGAATVTEILPFAAVPERSALPRLYDGEDFEYQAGLMARIFLTEIVERRQLRDAALLREILCKLLANLNGSLSAPKIAAMLKDGGRTVSVHTAGDYLSALVDAYVVYPVPRYDIASQTVLRSTMKYFVADPGGMLRHYLGDSKAQTLRAALAVNAVWAALTRAGGRVYTGRNGNKSVDLVHIVDGVSAYYQLADGAEELAKKIRVLSAIRDQYPKTVLTLDEQSPADHRGIKILSVADFFRKENQTSKSN